MAADRYVDPLTDRPDHPCPDPPAHHVDSDACRHGWMTWDDAGTPIWLWCDCEDPAHPWPPREVTDGPRDCMCYFCMNKPRPDRGRAPCEYVDHHCPLCHEKGYCTARPCLEARHKGVKGDQI